MKKFIYILLFLINLNAIAQKLNVQVSTKEPNVGEPFEISFVMNTPIQDFVPPSFSNFELISGPNHSQNIQFINGNVSQSYSISYVLLPKKEGPVVINAAKAIVNGQTIYSSPITLNVQKNQNNSNYASNQRNNSSNASTNVDKEDIFIRTFVNKKQCYLGEQITLTQKIYTHIELRGIQNVKFPHLEAFWSKNQENHNNIQLHIENIDGINYYVGEISTQYIFPQRSGKLTISPIEIECVVRKRVNRAPRDMFEQFFGVNAFEDKIVNLKSMPINITVNDLPVANKPQNFSGAVGTNFSFKTEISKTKVHANDAIKLKITISGSGNIPLVEAPKINFPADFETYDPQIIENISTSNGISGTKTYEYLIIPRTPGTYKLSDIAFSYFNLNTKQYVSIPASEIIVEVSEPLNNNSAQVYQQYKQEIASDKENDIHFIKTLPFTVYKNDKTFFNSPLHLTFLIFPYLAMLGLIGFYQYQKKEKSDWASFQQKRAQKIALKYLHTAEKMIKENKQNEFYTAIIQSLENYLMFKFKINKSELNKTKILEIMNHLPFPDKIKQNYTEIINTCELAKYAPITANNSLSDIFINTKNLIIEIENFTKNA